MRKHLVVGAVGTVIVRENVGGCGMGGGWKGACNIRGRTLRGGEASVRLDGSCLYSGRRKKESVVEYWGKEGGVSICPGVCRRRHRIKRWSLELGPFSSKRPAC